MKKKVLFSREEMTRLSVEALRSRGVTVDDIAEIAFKQQARYTENIKFETCRESVLKVLSLRDIFHHVLLAVELDKMAEKKLFEGPIQDIIESDLGLFGVDEVLGLDVARLYGVIGMTNFGDIDVNKHGIVSKLNEDGKKEGIVHTFLDDIVGAIAASASTRVAQIINEDIAQEEPHKKVSLFDQ
ncbi:MAG: phosphatidylglycerophosphatase A [Paracholeplasma sp.]|jgi:phosphatidylglycerophosphatase A|uniref:Phosphatidylglycerophosphatase A n=1 Tax=Acholeplasma brassicae TaxID=61635 RepID=U4KMZ3_9MOLU|nr:MULTISPECIES: phosphatidylglycerophosphatase A [Paracholeplasma]MDY3195552.1 phosphatidylglycerophosphatase A [Paracholeplasma sp.]CCV65637.1 Phosphatidylglycerophosphatase A [Paracholeplasma brassicae]